MWPLFCSYPWKDEWLSQPRLNVSLRVVSTESEGTIPLSCSLSYTPSAATGLNPVAYPLLDVLIGTLARPILGSMKLINDSRFRKADEKSDIGCSAHSRTGNAEGKDPSRLLRNGMKRAHSGSPEEVRKRAELNQVLVPFVLTTTNSHSLFNFWPIPALQPLPT